MYERMESQVMKVYQKFGLGVTRKGGSVQYADISGLSRKGCPENMWCSRAIDSRDQFFIQGSEFF